MSRTKRVLITIGVTLLAIGVVVGAFWGFYIVAFKPSVQSILNTAYLVNLPEECELLYSNTEDVGGFPSDGTSYYVFDLTNSGTAFANKYFQGKNDALEEGFFYHFERVKQATLPKEVPAECLPSFGADYRWRLISKSLSGRAEFTGSFESEEEAREFYKLADLLYIVVLPQTNRMFVLNATI